MPGFTYNNRLQPNQVYATIPNTNDIDNGAQLFLYYLWLNWGATTNNGNLLQLDEEVSTVAAPYSSLTTYGQNFSYDTVNRLVSASDSGGWTRNFAYDQYGNGWVTGWTGIGLALMEPTSGTLYNTKNQIGSSPYDANGNMETLPPGMTFTYDAENRQTAESNSDGMSATYLYDGDGRRVEKVLASGQTTIYVYDANGDLAAEYDKNPPAPMCRTCYLNYDHLGSIRLVTDQNANIVARHSYLPFGEEVPGGSAGRSSQFDASDNLSQRFTGKERDSETSLDYFGARHYGSGMGRWVSPDEPLADQHPEDPQSWNLYEYVRNNPLLYTDPSGRSMADGSADGEPDPSGSSSTQEPCYGPVINCAPSISPLPKTPGTQTRQRLVGVLKGAAIDFLQLAQWLAGNPDGSEASKLITELQPGTQDEKFGGKVFALLGAIIPGGETERVIRIVEEDAGAVHLAVESAKGSYEVVANMRREGGKIILDGAHMEGSGAGQFGAGMVGELRGAARQFGQEQGASEVVVNPGVRTSGANPGRAMNSFSVKVKQ